MRFVVCIDVKSEDIKEGYLQLRDLLMKGDKSNLEGWETTDEAYYADGEEIKPDILSKEICDTIINDLNED